LPFGACTGAGPISSSPESSAPDEGGGPVEISRL
jgi:hypothetical protein